MHFSSGSPTCGRLVVLGVLVMLLLSALFTFPSPVTAAAQAAPAESGSSGTEPRSRSVRQFPALDPKAVDDYVKKQQDGLHIPGLALVVIRDRQVAYARGYGSSDDFGRQVTIETRFLFGSVTKQLTGLVVQNLVVQGRLKPDAPIRSYLPWFGTGPDDPHGQITVQQLLGHTSGLPREADIDWTRIDDPTDTLEAKARRLATISLNRSPGSGFEYSNNNYDLLGYLVEVVTGKPFDRVLQDSVLTPLRMTGTVTSLAAAGSDNLAQGHYTLYGQFTRPAPIRFVRSSVPSMSTIGTAADLARLLQAHLGTGPKVSPEALARTRQPLSRINDRVEYGSGWFIHRFWQSQGPGEDPNDPQTPMAYTHDSSSMSYRSAIAFSQELGYGLVVLSNSDDRIDPGRWGKFVDGLTRTTLGQPVPSTELLSREGLRSHPLLILLALPSAILGSAAMVWSAPGRRLWMVFLSWVLSLAGLVAMFWYIPIQPDVSYSTLTQTWIIMPDIGLSTLVVCVGTVLVAIASWRWRRAKRPARTARHRRPRQLESVAPGAADPYQ